MFGIFLYDLIFFGVPVVFLALFGYCLYRFRSAKKQNSEQPGSVSDSEVKSRKIWAIVSGIVAAIPFAIVVGLIAMMFMAVAYM